MRVRLISVVLIFDVDGNYRESLDELFEQHSDHVFSFSFPIRMVEKEIQKTQLRCFPESVKEDRPAKSAMILKQIQIYEMGFSSAIRKVRGIMQTDIRFPVQMSTEGPWPTNFCTPPISRTIDTFHPLEKAGSASGQLYLPAKSIRGLPTLLFRTGFWRATVWIYRLLCLCRSST